MRQTHEYIAGFFFISIFSIWFIFFRLYLFIPIIFIHIYQTLFIYFCLFYRFYFNLIYLSNPMWRYIGLARIVQIVRVSRHAFVGLFCGAFFDLIWFNFFVETRVASLEPWQKQRSPGICTAWGDGCLGDLVAVIFRKEKWGIWRNSSENGNGKWGEREMRKFGNLEIWKWGNGKMGKRGNWGMRKIWGNRRKR